MVTKQKVRYGKSYFLFIKYLLNWSILGWFLVNGLATNLYPLLCTPSIHVSKAHHKTEKVQISKAYFGFSRIINSLNASVPS